MEPKEKLKTLPELPLKLIFNDLSFQDIMNLVKTPKQNNQLDQNKKNKTHMVNDLLPRGTKSNPITID